MASDAWTASGLGWRKRSRQIYSAQVFVWYPQGEVCIFPAAFSQRALDTKQLDGWRCDLNVQHCSTTHGVTAFTLYIPYISVQHQYTHGCSVYECLSCWLCWPVSATICDSAGPRNLSMKSGPNLAKGICTVAAMTMMLRYACAQ